jgi:hypothetical protein
MKMAKDKGKAGWDKARKDEGPGEVDLAEMGESAEVSESAETKPEGDRPEGEVPQTARGALEAPSVPLTTQVVSTDDEAAAAGLIASAGIVDEDEWEKVFLDIKSRGNYFDLVRNMYPFHLPDLLSGMQDRKERRYGFFDKESMQIKCDPSKLIYWTPVNAVNHPMLPQRSFDRHGGFCREGMYLCYMPWKMYAARQEIMDEANKLKYDLGDDLVDKKAVTEKGTVEIDHYKPAEGPGGAAVVEEGVIGHRGREGEGIPHDESLEVISEYAGWKIPEGGVNCKVTRRIKNG